MRIPRLAILIPAALVVVSATAAWAAVVSDTGSGSTRPEACQAAKDRVSNTIALKYSGDRNGPYRTATVGYYSQCECEDQGADYEPGSQRWQCNVDAYFEPQNGTGD